MYTSIKAYNEKAFESFYKEIGGLKDYRNNDVVFDIIKIDNLQITFYSNLTILFKGFITNEMEKLIDAIIDPVLYVGSDEVGVGESIGPLVAVALKFNDYDSKKKVILSGIKDSKKMTAKDVKDKAKIIRANSEFYIAKLEPVVFNKVYKKNPNVKAINAILQNELHKNFEGKNYKHVTDQFVNENKYKQYIKDSDNQMFNGKLHLLTKAEEQYLEVAAAAIVAKDIFNDWVVNNLNEEGYKIEIKNKLNSWDLFLKIKSGEIKVKDKMNYIKDWKK